MEDYKSQGDNFYNNKEYLNAISMYSLGLSCKQENESCLLKLYLNRNLSYMKLNKYEDAYNDAHSAIQLDYNNAKSWGRLGSALYALGRFNSAKDVFKLSYKLEPNELIFEQINRMQDSLQASKSSSEEDTDTDTDTETEDEDNIVVNNNNTNNIQVKNLIQHFYKNGQINILNITKSINNILSNEEILDKIKDNNFQNKVFGYKNNIMNAFNDNEIVDTMNNIFRNINKTL